MKMPIATPLEQSVRMSYYEEGKLWGRADRVREEIAAHESAIASLNAEYEAIKRQLTARGVFGELAREALKGDV